MSKKQGSSIGLQRGPEPALIPKAERKKNADAERKKREAELKKADQSKK